MRHIPRLAAPHHMAPDPHRSPSSSFFGLMNVTCAFLPHNVCANGRSWESKARPAASRELSRVRCGEAELVEVVMKCRLRSRQPVSTFANPLSQSLSHNAANPDQKQLGVVSCCATPLFSSSQTPTNTSHSGFCLSPAEPHSCTAPTWEDCRCVWPA